MPYSLKGRNVLVTGGSRGLGALICEKFAAEGSNVMINYVSNKDRADEVAEKLQKTFAVRVGIIQGDASVLADNVRLVKETQAYLGGLDIIIANAGWTRFSEFGNLNDLSYEEWNKGLLYSQQKIEHLKRRAALQQETLLDDCADAYISAAKNTSMTGQQIVVVAAKDSGVIIK
ncbi:hypothetical protein GGI42DRAFT_353290 [Trichoderma sp. SZMC 28013]